MHIDSIYDLEQRSDTYNSLRKDEAETDSSVGMSQDFRDCSPTELLPL